MGVAEEVDIYRSDQSGEQMMRDFGGSMKREDYDGVFKALGDEHRLRILRLLAKKELSAGEILESMDIVQSTLSHHMKILVECGLVNDRKEGKWHHYSLNCDTLLEFKNFIGSLTCESCCDKKDSCC